jgi:hypothetical protein
MLTVLFLVLAAPPSPAQKDAEPKATAPNAAKAVKLDPFIEKLTEPDAKDTQLVKLQKERARERALYAVYTQEVMRIGNWDAAYYADYTKEVKLLWENLAEVTTKPEDRVKCYEMRLAAAKEFEKFFEVRVQNASDPPTTLHKAKAARIDAEIDLLKLKESLKDKK